MTDEDKVAIDHADKAVPAIRKAVEDFGRDNPECPALSMSGVLMLEAFKIHATLFDNKEEYLFSILDLASSIYDTMRGEENGTGESSE